MTTALTQPEQIAGFALASLRSAVKLQAAGLKMSRGRSALTIAKSFGYRGTAATVADQLSRDVAAHQQWWHERCAGAANAQHTWQDISDAGRAALAAYRHPDPYAP